MRGTHVSVIVSNGQGSSLEIQRVKASDGSGILIVCDNTSHDSREYAEIFFPKERVAAIIAALEDEAGV